MHAQGFNFYSLFFTVFCNRERDFKLFHTHLLSVLLRPRCLVNRWRKKSRYIAASSRLIISVVLMAHLSTIFPSINMGTISSGRTMHSDCNLHPLHFLNCPHHLSVSEIIWSVLILTHFIVWMLFEFIALHPSPRRHVVFRFPIASCELSHIRQTNPSTFLLIT